MLVGEIIEGCGENATEVKRLKRHPSVSVSFDFAHASLLFHRES
ncbi:hypothetical protein RSSM_05331 [Rhodopirellula sallentina SM41]|uniref:Uncharacterized protein n=1 Tax=Rhodopirellula sallentina SM41 TaxID=1263870 RepID=M5TVK3_9BACT|nr:hypothetical protein RSSM_05331 [Rhodopirellula sallentina SM41]